MKTKISILILFSLFFQFSRAQNPLDRNKTLIVVLHVENQKFRDKLSRKNKLEELKNYRKLINEYNINIKEAVSKQMKYFRLIEYKTEVEADLYKKNELANKYFLRHTFPVKTDPGALNAGTGFSENGAAYTPLPEELNLDTTNKNENTILEIREYENKEEFTPVLKINLARLFCTKAEIYFAVKRLNIMCPAAQGLLFTSPEINKEEMLKSKTLIINAGDLTKDLTETEIKKIYPYSFKIVDKPDFDKYILNENESTVCLMILPYVGLVHFLYDTYTGDMQFGAVKAKKGNPGNSKITTGSFEDYLKEK